MKYAAAALCAASLTVSAQETLYIDAGSRGHDINPGMYGIFFEEINHSGDGGLYAELIQNRGFEEHRIPGGFHEDGPNKISTDRFVRYQDLVTNQLRWDWNYDVKKMTGWEVNAEKCMVKHDVAIPTVPLHENTPNAMHISITGSQAGAKAKLVNTGYWGIAYKKDAHYDLRFYLNTGDYKGKVSAVAYNADCTETLGRLDFDVDSSGEWKEYKGVIVAEKTINDGRFALVFEGDGNIDVDYVSLFPQDTYMGRQNGMRPDLAQFLVDMKPKFLRWPGGCIVEGIVLGNRVKWKETLGDPMTRPGEYDLWGYRSTWGMGYHEILQFCEDTGMDCMFVGNAGLSCTGWGGEYVKGDDVEPYYEDIRDAIEYAIGDPAKNEWAARRAEAGHPEPFPLKYVEIGNENFTARYDANYKYIYDKLKAEYPQLIFLNTMGIDHAEEFGLRTDMIDPHWYVAPDFFYNNRTIFDKTPRGHYDIYVGEYATTSNVGKGNMDAALSEAVFMMSMERNSDIVKMASYAPLITNDNAPNWPCNLIWQHSGELFGRASYYTQKLFGENVPSYNIANALHSSRVTSGYDGRAGIGTWSTAAEFRNFKVTDHDGKLLYAADFDGKRDEWTDMQGTWKTGEEGAIMQTNNSLTRCITLMNHLAFRDGVIEVEAKKNSGAEGFLLTFGCNDGDWDHYCQFNVGGWGNTGVAFEDVNNGGGAIVSQRKDFKIENGKWYKLKVVCRNGKVEGYVDDKLYCSVDFGKQGSGRVAAHTGYDEEAKEIVLKVVNAESKPLPLTLAINAYDIAAEADVEVMKSATLWDENSFSVPTLIAPVKGKTGGVSDRFKYTFEPFSLTVMRIKATPAASAMDIPDYEYTCTPRELDVTIEEKGAKGVLRKMAAESRAVMLDDVEGYDALRVAVEAAEDVLAKGGEEQIAEAVEPLRNALNTYYKGVMNASTEMTDKIVNPHFEIRGDNKGWSGNPTVNEHVAEIYNSAFSVSQTIEGLEEGYYLVYAQGYYRNGGHELAHSRHADGTEELLTDFSVNDMSKPVVSLMSEVHDGYWWGAPNTMGEAHAVFSESPDYFANYLMAYVSDGTLRIAFEKSKTYDADWFCFDNVRLFRVPTAHTDVIEIEDAISSYSPSAIIYDMQGRRMGSYAGIDRLAPGLYIITENGRSSKFRR